MVSLAVICFVLLFAGVGMASATTYYISPSGDDDSSGTSSDSAWASLSHACAGAIKLIEWYNFHTY